MRTLSQTSTWLGAAASKMAFNAVAQNLLQTCLVGSRSRSAMRPKGSSIQAVQGADVLNGLQTVEGKQVSNGCFIAAPERVAYRRRSLFPVGVKR